MSGFNVHDSVASPHVGGHTGGRRGEELALVSDGRRAAEGVQQCGNTLAIQVRLADHEEKDEENRFRRVHDAFHGSGMEDRAVVGHHVQELRAVFETLVEDLGAAGDGHGGMKRLPFHSYSTRIGGEEQRGEVEVVFLTGS